MKPTPGLGDKKGLLSVRGAVTLLFLSSIFHWECVAQFVQVSGDMNSECFQLENNFIICYRQHMISTRPGPDKK